jgi:hypothetical protein
MKAPQTAPEPHHSPEGPTAASTLAVADNAFASALVALQLLSADAGKEVPKWMVARLGAASSKMALREARRGQETPSRAHRSVFLTGLGAGLPVELAASIAGYSDATFYKLRRTDKEFAADWADALEESVAVLESRLMEIGLTGDMGNMATVRAIETLARIRHPKVQQQPAVSREMKEQSPDGTIRTITIRGSATPLPD